MPQAPVDTLTHPGFTQQGLVWVSENAQQPAVVHMSIHGPLDETVNEATEMLTRDHGIPVIVSAGNWGR